MVKSDYKNKVGATASGIDSPRGEATVPRKMDEVDEQGR